MGVDEEGFIEVEVPSVEKKGIEFDEEGLIDIKVDGEINSDEEL